MQNECLTNKSHCELCSETSSNTQRTQSCSLLSCIYATLERQMIGLHGHIKNFYLSNWYLMQFIFLLQSTKWYIQKMTSERTLPRIYILKKDIIEYEENDILCIWNVCVCVHCARTTRSSIFTWKKNCVVYSIASLTVHEIRDLRQLRQKHKNKKQFSQSARYTFHGIKMRRKLIGGQKRVSARRVAYQIHTI